MALAMPEFIQFVRKFIRDFPKANELRGIAESTDTEIGMCIMLALDDYNMTPPPIRQVSLEAHPSTHLLLLGTLTQLFLSNGILQFRNNLTYSDGGIPVNVWDKGPAYVGNAQLFAQLWESKKIALKRSINVAQGFGIIQSAEFNVYNYTAFFGGDYVTTNASGIPLGGVFLSSGFPNYQGGVAIPESVRTASTPLSFLLTDWHLSSTLPNVYEFIYVHNLANLRVETVVLDSLNQDVTSGLSITYLSENHLKLSVNGLGNTFAGTIQCFVR